VRGPEHHDLRETGGEGGHALQRLQHARDAVGDRVERDHQHGDREGEGGVDEGFQARDAGAALEEAVGQRTAMALSHAARV
jgi:hypothetical protein